MWQCVCKHFLTPQSVSGALWHREIRYIRLDTLSLGGYIHSGVFKWFVITDDLKLFFWQDRIINLAVGGFTSLVVLVSTNLRHCATELFLSSTSFLRFVWSLQLKAILSFAVLLIANENYISFIFPLSMCWHESSSSLKELNRVFENAAM